MSAQTHKTGRYFARWFKPYHVTLSSFGLPWFFLLSALIHFAVLWKFPYIPPHTPRPFSSSIVVVTRLASEVRASSSTEPARSRGPATSRASALSPERPDAPPSSRSEHSPPAGGASAGSEDSIGLGNIATEGGGVGVAGLGPATGSGGTTRGGTGSGPGIGASESTPGFSTARGAPSTPDTSAIAIPESIRGSASPYDGEIYVEADSYVLFGPDLRAGLSVAGNEVCLDGDILRTHKRQAFSQTITDISKCEFVDYGDDETMRCPPRAHAWVVFFDNYLSSPVKYSINVCLAYDRSNCYWNFDDDGSDREVCRAGTEYKGIWADGTMFHYRCTKSTSQTYSHPLQYEIRFMQDIERMGGGMRRRLLLREKRSVAQCR